LGRNGRKRNWGNVRGTEVARRGVVGVPGSKMWRMSLIEGGSGEKSRRKNVKQGGNNTKKGLTHASDGKRKN